MTRSTEITTKRNILNLVYTGPWLKLLWIDAKTALQRERLRKETVFTLAFVECLDRKIKDHYNWGKTKNRVNGELYGDRNYDMRLKWRWKEHIGESSC